MLCRANRSRRERRNSKVNRPLLRKDRTPGRDLVPGRDPVLALTREDPIHLR